MKFRIRYADQLVGVLVVFAVLALIFTIFLLGRAQQWFAITHTYVTYAATASGLSRNMPVNFRGLPIGNVRSFQLTADNRIEVIFTINDDFNNRVRQGSVVEVSVSPIGIGSQFIFHAGLGPPLEEHALIPMRDSPEGRAFIAQGLTYIPAGDDFLALLVEQASALLGGVERIVDGVALALEGLNVAPNEPSVTALGQTIANVQTATAALADDLTEAQVISALETTLLSLAGLLDNLEQTTAHLPREMPQIMALIAEARFAVQSADAVLVGLSNNPLLRRGIPDRAEIDTSGTNPRNIRF